MQIYEHICSRLTAGLCTEGQHKREGNKSVFDQPAESAAQFGYHTVRFLQNIEVQSKKAV